MSSAPSPMLQAARHALELGISVVPPSEDGAKRPYASSGEWKSFQEVHATEQEIRKWYGSRTGLGFVCGTISRGLELFEFDDSRTYEQFREAAFELGAGDLIQRIEDGYLERTPGGGYHWLYYCSEIKGSTKLAIRKTQNGDGRPHVKTLIETKGEGGYVVVAPSYGKVHPSEKPYELLSGSMDSIATLSGMERDWLWDLGRTFNEVESPPLQVDPGKPARAANQFPDITSPGDEFNLRAEWGDILDGWTLAYRRGQTEFWRRPGKSIGHSATVNFYGTQCLHVFSSSTEFEPGRAYTKFGAWVVLAHKGDYKAAAKELYLKGYGTHKRWIKRGMVWKLEIFQNPVPKGERSAKVGDEPPAPSPNGVPSLVKPQADPEDFESLTNEELGLVQASTIKPESVTWEWKNRIARGKMNLIAGEGGDGKSQIALAIIAAVTSGGVFPDGTPVSSPGNCLILAAEDGAADTVVPRLVASGADLDRVSIATAKVSYIKEGKKTIHPISFQDLDYWRTVLSRNQIRVLVADPVPTYLGRGVNDRRNAEVRSILEPFVDLLNELKTSLLAITHLNKSTDHKSPLHRVLDSVAYTNLSRTVYCTYRDKDDESKRYWSMEKCNIAAKQPCLGYTIEPYQFESEGEIIQTSRVVFTGEIPDFNSYSHLNGNSNKQGPIPTTSLRNAEWLYDLLFGAGWMPFAEIADIAGEYGMIGELGDDGRWTQITSLYRAKDKVEKLEGNKAGCTVDECKMQYRGVGKMTPHWKLVSLDNGEPPKQIEEIPDDDTPF